MRTLCRCLGALLLGMALARSSLGAAKQKPVPAAPGLADNLGVSGQAVTIFQPDPKFPGRFLFKIWARGVQAKSAGSAFDGTLNGVSAVLFQHGKPTAKLSAPMANARSADQAVVASGRVHVVSLTQPGTTIDADTVIWHARTNLIDAVGHVQYRNGKNGVTLRGPHFQANTALQTINSVGPGQATFH